MRKVYRAKKLNEDASPNNPVDFTNDEFKSYFDTDRFEKYKNILTNYETLTSEIYNHINRVTSMLIESMKTIYVVLDKPTKFNFNTTFPTEYEITFSIPEDSITKITDAMKKNNQYEEEYTEKENFDYFLDDYIYDDAIPDIRYILDNIHRDTGSLIRKVDLSLNTEKMELRLEFEMVDPFNMFKKEDDE